MGMQLVILAISTLSTTRAPEVMNVNAINTLSPSSRAASLPFSSITEIFLSPGYGTYVQSLTLLILASSGNKWSA